MSFSSDKICDKV